MSDFMSIFGLEEEDPKQLGDVLVHTPGDASNAMAIISHFKRRIAEAEEIEKAEIARIKAWRKRVEEKWQERLGPYEYGLKVYISERRKQDPKYVLKSPYGSAFIVKQAPTWNWPDDATLVAKLKELGKDALIKVTEVPKKNDIKTVFTVAADKAVDGDGVVLEGVTVSEGEERLQLRLTAAEAINIDTTEAA